MFLLPTGYRSLTCTAGVSGECAKGANTRFTGVDTWVFCLRNKILQSSCYPTQYSGLGNV